MNRAAQFRQAVQAQYPGAVVSRRWRNGIEHRSGNHTVIDAVVGALHTEAGTEIDTTWRPAVAPWIWEITEADFLSQALSLFGSGQIVKYTHKQTGESVAFQPQSLQWTNDLDQIQQIAAPQAVQAVANDNVLGWSGAYGAGLDYAWINKPDRLAKLLTIQSLAAIGAPNATIVSGGNPVLRMQFIFSPSSHADIYVDGVLWTRNQAANTFGNIEFRHDQTGQALWWFSAGKAWDTFIKNVHDVETITPLTRLRRAGNNLFVEIRVPWAWLQNAIYPVYIDPTIDVSVGASTDDAWENSSGTMDLTSTSHLVDGTNEWMGARFTGITIPAGATFNSSYMTWYFPVSTTDEPQVTIYGEDAASPATYGSGANNISSRADTSASVAYDNANLGAPGSFNTPNIASILDELLASYGPGPLLDRGVSG